LSNVRQSRLRLACAEGRRLNSVEAIYERLAPIYDLIYGVTLEPGRRRAMARLAPAGGESILEIGVGTGLSAMAYPPGCRVVAIDLSAHMIGRAHARFVRHGVHHVTLCRMDAARLAFPDACFDAIYAAYVMNVVRDPVTVVRDMIRVCRPSGRIVFLNHFDRAGGSRGGLDGLLGRLASRAGVDWHVDLPSFLHAAGLTSLSIDRVNVPRVSSVVVCRKPRQPATG
jgi:phosphatidylethanolamine/phosphatidyl-N-methylethanolamine N-methyltransferase